MVLTMPFISCKDNSVPKDDDDNDSDIWIATASYKVNGNLIEVKKDRADISLYPAIVLSNDQNMISFLINPEQGVSFGFNGEYLSGSSRIYKEGFMDYIDPEMEHYHYSDTNDMCDKDSFIFEVRRQPVGNLGFYRYTGTFSGRLTYYYTDPNSVEIQDPCAKPIFLEITEGKFSIVAL